MRLPQLLRKWSVFDIAIEFISIRQMSCLSTEISLNSIDFFHRYYSIFFPQMAHVDLIEKAITRWSSSGDERMLVNMMTIALLLFTKELNHWSFP